VERVPTVKQATQVQESLITKQLESAGLRFGTAAYGEKLLDVVSNLEALKQSHSE
jgi:hypothetical protein